MAFWNSTQIQDIYEGSQPNDGTGDSIRDAFLKVDSNFANVSTQLGLPNQDFLNANIEFNLNAEYSNLTNMFVANATGTNSSFTGNSTVGNLIANAGIHVGATSTFLGDVYINGNIIPVPGSSWNLGSATNPFQTIYYNTAIVGTTALTSDAGLFQVHANVVPGDQQDIGIFGNIYNNFSSNQYAFFGHQYTTNNFVYKITPTNWAANAQQVSDGIYGNVQFGSAFLSNTTVSANTATGALIVAGGAGIAGALNVGGVTTIAGNTSVHANIIATGNIYSCGYQVVTTNSSGIGNVYNGTSAIITGNIVYPSATMSTSYTTGALVIPNGGIGVYGNVVGYSGFVGPHYGTIMTAAQPNITSLGTITSLNAGSISATSLGVASTNISSSGIVTNALTGLAALSVSGNVTAGNVSAMQFNGNLQGAVFTAAQPNITSVGNLVSLAVNSGGITSVGNISTNGYILGNGSLLSGMFGNTQVAAYLPTNSTIFGIQANLGAYQIYANANIGTLTNSVNTINANLGAFQTYANTSIGTATNNAINSINANVGAYQIYANANIGTLTTGVNSINANLGAYQTFANSRIQTLDANLGTATTNVTTLLANAASQESAISGLRANITAANASIVASSYTNANVAAYLLTNTGNIQVGNLLVTNRILPTANATSNIGSSTAWFNTIFGTASQAQYADLAEHYAADADYAPGTVVVFGGEAEITTTAEFADARVAGAISTDPAYLMNASEPGLPLALRGRVPVKVVGPVTKGDSLVTAGANPGYAVSVGTCKEYGQAVFAKSIETNLDEGPKTITAVIL